MAFSSDDAVSWKSETGIAGTGMVYLPEPGGRAGEDDGGDEPEEVVVKALQCFSEKHIYSSCDESYRLTESGQLHVPPEYTDEYCNGPWLQETHLVLTCVDNILSHFIFYNHATIKDVKETIKMGCNYGPHRGDFNVVEHIEGYESSSFKLSYTIILFSLQVIGAFPK
ncbi:hypothetical protein L1987_09949 [Smallanthus sonchifolius]|uniref:Uncharacterized protein n=1 Tax=Smallanthus sonchifolius TaxID=185202 RepID=A0ACB9JQR0_9ASTR|nr:hypothetical protein L1987_09949 [Smallanthus sonchifolius]